MSRSGGRYTIITKPMVGKILSMLDLVYRQGVKDAWTIDDEGLARDFLDQTSQAGIFGFLTDDYTIDYCEYSLRLRIMMRGTAWRNAMSEFVDKIGGWGVNYLCVFYNIAQCFYNRGVRDMLNNSKLDITLFNSETRIRIVSDGIIRQGVQTYVEDIQQMCNDLSRRDKFVFENENKSVARKIAIRANLYEMFRQAIGLAWQK